MARSSQARAGQAPRATKPNAARKRTAPRVTNGDGAPRVGNGKAATQHARAGRPAAESQRPAPAKSQRAAPARSQRPETTESQRPEPAAPRSTQGAPLAGSAAGAAAGTTVPRPHPAGAEAAVTAPEPTVAGTAGVEAAAADETVPAPARLPGQTPDLTAMVRASCALVEGSMRVRSQMIGFGYRQAEHGFAVGRAVLAGGWLPAVLSLNAEYLGRAVDDALELSRVSTDVVRAGLESLRPR